MVSTNNGEIGVGLISVGWMGKLHTRAYQALPSIYPELGLRPRLVHAADTAPDRVEYACESWATRTRVRTTARSSPTRTWTWYRFARPPVCTERSRRRR